MLSHPDDAVCYWAASHLGDIGVAGRPALSAVEARMARAPLAVQIALAYAGCRIDEPTGERLQVLRSGLSFPERGMACSAAEFLGRIGPPARAALPALEAALKQHAERGGDYHVRGAAQNAIRQVRDDKELVNHQRPLKGGAFRGLQFRDKTPAKVVAADPSGRPNILWISCEDISSNLGCYGDSYARTPNLDRLASEGARFDHAFTPAGVCAVVRSGIITGLYPISLGSQHMRSRIVPRPAVRCFTEYLRAAGYFCTNRSKTDYQFDNPRSAWDRQGNGHNDWRDRAAGQPFFSVINLTVSHESQIRHSEEVHAKLIAGLQPDQRHDPEEAAKHLPPIYPNTPEAQKDWAWYADNISEMDRQAGLILKRLEQDGLAGNTIVVFWSDHGRGLPRGKRWIYDSGVHVPMIVRWPEKITGGSVRNDLVSTQDLPSTMLALAGIDPPAYMQGRVFLGERVERAPEFLFFHRDRMDEALELMRAARDHRFKYIRNYEPRKPYAQHIDYMDKMPTLVDLRRLDKAGELTGAAQTFMRKEKPLEELYDLQADPHETVNLADSTKHQQRIAVMRAALERWQERIGDLGLVPEPILMERMRAGGQWRTTAEPTIQASPQQQATLVSIACATNGASIEFAVGDGSWKIYDRPFTAQPPVAIKARAGRIGFRDSPIATTRIAN
jgi:uncharacterized sulfatase